jgi:hypothetical protein
MDDALCFDGGGTFIPEKAWPLRLGGEGVAMVLNRIRKHLNEVGYNSSSDRVQHLPPTAGPAFYWARQLNTRSHTHG